MNSKGIKILSSLAIMVMMISVVGAAYAVTPSDITGNANVQGASEIQTLGQSIVGILQTVGIVLSVVVLIIIGIKYMMGSAEEKAEYKKTLLPYVIGAVFVFGAGVIATVLFNIAQTDWSV